MRASIFLEANGHRVLVDCGADFRTQALRHNVTDVDAVLLTHTHSDHVNGLDDLRSFNMVHHHPIPIFASAPSLEDIGVRFAYCFRPPPPGGGIPDLHLNEIVPYREFQTGGLAVMPLTVMHGGMPILGFRFGRFAYLTDVSAIPEETYAALDGLEVLITGALRHKPHPSHMSLLEAIAVAQRVGADRTFFTHMSHDLDHFPTNNQLPAGIELGYDGMTFDL